MATTTPKPKYKVGDWVYSWQNLEEKGKITRIERGQDGYPHRYYVSVYNHPDGYPRVLKAMHESSLTKRRTKEWLRENDIRKPRRK